MDVWYASQTSIVHDGWEVGDGLEDCATSWDAWNLGRPNDELTERNTPAAGMPDVSGEPLLPRRLLVTVELERPVDVKRRATLIAACSSESNELVVDDDSRVPERDAMVLVDEEWMKVLRVGSGYVSVLRGQRGTRPALHEAGSIVHWGVPMKREIPIPTVREDWDL